MVQKQKMPERYRSSQEICDQHDFSCLTDWGYELLDLNSYFFPQFSRFKNLFFPLLTQLNRSPSTIVGSSKFSHSSQPAAFESRYVYRMSYRCKSVLFSDVTYQGHHQRQCNRAWGCTITRVIYCLSAGILYRHCALSSAVNSETEVNYQHSVAKCQKQRRVLRPS